MLSHSQAGEELLNPILHRPDKLDNAQILLFEIDMLRHAYNRLVSPPASWSTHDEWVYLEDFLLHYRNLIEFFGKPNNQKNPTDLTIQDPHRIWKILPCKKDLELMTIHSLWERYDSRDNNESISKYLHHCTSHRTEAKNWNVEEMFEQLRPVIERLESLLPNYKPATIRARRDPGDLSEGNSTDTTRTHQWFEHNERG